ncbi:MAG: DUF4135 domain-containing protein, partial [bacterium]|nr:DUF4135 domain-containing protein [bacterium]
MSGGHISNPFRIHSHERSSREEIEALLEFLILNHTFDRSESYWQAVEQLDAIVPFCSAIAPVAFISDRVLYFNNDDLELAFSSVARTKALEWLIRSLSKQLAPTLLHLFDLMRRTELSEIQRLQLMVSEHPSTDIYLNYFEDKSGASLWRKLQSYPEARRICLQTMTNWLVYLTELGERIQNDAADIGVIDPCIVVDASFGHSDPHDGHRTVAIINFKETCWVYKPRCAGPIVEFQLLLKQANTSIPNLSVRRISCHVKDGYCWIEYIAQRGCQNLTEARGFFYRAGALCALLYVLGA